MNAQASGLATAFAYAVFCATAAQAQTGWPGPALGWPTDGRPAIERDLSGNKICWNDGGISVFEANGHFTNDKNKHSKWLVTEPGVVKVGIKYRQYLVLSDGRFYQHAYYGHQSITGHVEFWGKICN